DQVAPQRRRPAGRHADEARRAAAAPVQGRGAARRRGARHAGADGVAPAVSRPRARDPDRRRGDRGAARDAAAGGRDLPRRDPPRRALPRALAELLRPAGDPLGGRSGRLAHLWLSDRDPGRDVRGCDDGRLGAPPVRPRRDDRLADRERDSGREPRRPRRHVEAARDDRVGVAGVATPPYRLETERLVVRCWDPADAPLLKDAVDRSRDHLWPWMAWTPAQPEELGVVVERLRRFRSLFDRDEEWIYGIFSRDESRVLGGTGLHPRGGPGSLEIGYWVAADAVRQGIATEVTAVLTRAAFEHAGADR